MQTELLQVDALRPAPAAIARAVDILKRGGLVAFPTETVYGLGANALDAAAVAKIFVAKGRPSANPLIVHVANTQGAIDLSRSWPASADRLAEHFWPGPLTIVVHKGREIPDLVTAGGDTVALRLPAHPVALALIKAAGVPLAAPSANRSARLSPTRAEHVLRDLGGRIDLILDGGPTPGGLESTVLDVTTLPPLLLRPGLIGPAAVEAVIGAIDRSDRALSAENGEPLRSPGMLGRHYAPRTPLECVAISESQRVHELRRNGMRVGWLALAPDHEPGDDEGIIVLAMASDPTAYAAQLYAALHTLDDSGVDRIVVDLPPATEDWLAVHDRLQRAAARA
jgi:L-threonylcarbamoyladenylate synthase